MKYIRQMCVILVFSLLGEFCRAVIPLSIPASIYGMVLLFAAMKLKIVSKEGVRETGGFLVALLPLIFVVPAVGLLEDWRMIAGNAAAFGCLIIVSLILTFAVSGLVTQAFIRRKGREKECD